MTTLSYIDISEGSNSIPNGTSRKYTATAYYTDNTNRDISDEVVWSVDNTSNAFIDNSTEKKGLLTALTYATTVVVTATEPGGATDTSTVYIIDADLTTISIEPNKLSLPNGTKGNLTAVGFYTDNTTRTITNEVTWASASTSIASISNDYYASGEVKADIAGTSSITATASNGVVGTTTVTVTSAVISGISISPFSWTLQSGLSKKFSVAANYTDGSIQDITSKAAYSIDNSAYAVIAADSGELNSITGGNVQVTANYEGYSATSYGQITGTVLNSIKVTADKSSVAAGLTQIVYATAYFADGSYSDISRNVIWKSSNTSLATIGSYSAEVTGVAQGTPTITADYVVVGSSTISDSMSIKVTTPDLWSIAVTPDGSSTPAGTQVAFTATGSYSDGTTADISSAVNWSSSKPTNVFIGTSGSSVGIADALVTGSSTITANLGSSIGQTSLSVSSANLTSVAVTPLDPTIPLGLTRQFVLTGTYSDTSTQDITNKAQWTSSNTTVSVSNSSADRGVVSTNYNTGAATITGAVDGLSDSSDVTVSTATVTSVNLTLGNTTKGVGLETSLNVQATYTNGYSSYKFGLSEVEVTSSNESVATIVYRERTTTYYRGRTCTKQIYDYNPIDVYYSCPEYVTKSLGLAVVGIRAIGTGTSTITATVGGVSTTQVFTVTANELISIDVTPKNGTYTSGGGTQQFTATGFYSDGTTSNLTNSVTWSSDDTSAATINSSGLMTATGYGTARIKAVSGAYEQYTWAVVDLESLDIDNTNYWFDYDGVGTCSYALGAKGYFNGGATILTMTSIVDWISIDKCLSTYEGAYKGTVITKCTKTDSLTLKVKLGSFESDYSYVDIDLGGCP